MTSLRRLYVLPPPGFLRTALLALPFPLASGQGCRWAGRPARARPDGIYQKRGLVPRSPGKSGIEPVIVKRIVSHGACCQTIEY